MTKKRKKAEKTLKKIEYKKIIKHYYIKLILKKIIKRYWFYKWEYHLFIKRCCNDV